MINSVTITVVLEIRVEAWASYLRNLPQLLKKIRAFPGLQDVRVVEHKQHPNKLLFIEKWRAEADYDAYVSHCSEYDDAETLAWLNKLPTKDVWPVDVSGN